MRFYVLEWGMEDEQELCRQAFGRLVDAQREMERIKREELSLREEFRVTNYWSSPTLWKVQVGTDKKSVMALAEGSRVGWEKIRDLHDEIGSYL